VTVALAREVASRVAALDGVVAVALGGSAGRGLADERSDLDLAVYYDPARPFSVAELAALATELDEHRQQGADQGELEHGQRRRERERASAAPASRTPRRHQRATRLAPDPYRNRAQRPNTPSPARTYPTTSQPSPCTADR
jgi:predicted nucleotidyltransferase